jgi:hypothetical protein
MNLTAKAPAGKSVAVPLVRESVVLSVAPVAVMGLLKLLELNSKLYCN